MKSEKKELNIFDSPFNVKTADMPDNLQHKIIMLQSNNLLLRAALFKSDSCKGSALLKTD